MWMLLFMRPCAALSPISFRAAPLSSSMALPPLGSADEVAKWLDQTFDAINYEEVLCSDEGPENGDFDDSTDEFIYGESSVRFFLSILDRALDVHPHQSDEPSGSGFVDLGGGKGQLALAAACVEPRRLSGKCVSLELLPELCAIGAGAAAVATAASPSMGRVAAVEGSMYDVPTLNGPCAIRAAAFVYAYATKFSSADGVHVEQLSAALAASELPRGTVVTTVNRRLCEADVCCRLSIPHACMHAYMCGSRDSTCAAGSRSHMHTCAARETPRVLPALDPNASGSSLWIERGLLSFGPHLPCSSLPSYA